MGFYEGLVQKVYFLSQSAWVKMGFYQGSYVQGPLSGAAPPKIDWLQACLSVLSSTAVIAGSLSMLSSTADSR